MVIKMVEDIEMLNFIYQNAEMGIIGIDNIKSVIKNKQFMKVIKEQEKDYSAVCTEAVELLNNAHEKVENISSMASLMTMIDAKMKTITDSSTSNIAKMMMTGSNKGIIEIQEKINNYKGDDKKVLSLAKKLLTIEKRNLENLKKYL